MQRMLPILAAVVVLTLAVPASAQEAQPSELTQIDYQAELDSINTEADWATALYVAGPILFAISGFGGVLLWGGGELARGEGCDNGVYLRAGAIACFIASGIGLVSFFVAIGLDVDSGSRRGALEERRPEGLELTSFDIAPTEGGAALQLGGRF